MEKTPSRVKVFAKKCNVAWPLGGGLSSNDAVLTAAIYSVRELVNQAVRSAL